MSAPEHKPIQDWNISTEQAMRVLGGLRDRVYISPEEDAALGAGRLALHKMLPEPRERVTDEMVQVVLDACDPHVLEAMNSRSTAKAVVTRLLERAMEAHVARFNKYRRRGSPAAPARRKYRG